MVIVILAGKKLSGKSTAAKYLSLYPGAVELTLAEPLKQAVKEVFLLDENQLHEQKCKETVDNRWGVSPRILFQRVGDLFRDHLDTVLPELICPNTIFIENLLLRIEQNKHSPLIIISDVRMADENTALKKLPDCYSIRIIRDTQTTDLHATEQINFFCDYEVYNNGTLDEYYQQLDYIMGCINK